MILKILEKQIPNWIRDICYIVMLLETIIVVIIYHRPDLFFKITMLFV